MLNKRKINLFPFLKVISHCEIFPENFGAFCILNVSCCNDVWILSRLRGSVLKIMPLSTGNRKRLISGSR